MFPIFAILAALFSASGALLALAAYSLFRHRKPSKLSAKQVAGQSVAIIGAGFGGIATANRCLDLGIPFTIYEMAEDFGGTWLKNTYPGSGCDIPSHLYSFSWRLNPNWSRKWVKQEEILAYIHRVAKRELKLEAHAHFRVRVNRAQFREGKWTLDVEDLATGKVTQHEHTFLMSAVGQLNIPHIPTNFNPKLFCGEAIFHSAEWPKNLDLMGKRVAVIGTGASAIQFVPQLAKQCKQVDVFQRSKFHVFEKADYAYPGWARWAFNYLPLVLKAYRLYFFVVAEIIFYMTIPKLRAGAARRAVFAKMSTDFMNQQADEETRPMLVPAQDQVLGCKRLLFSSEWCELFKTGGNTKLHMGQAREITPQGVDHIEADVVVFGTGFKAGSFLHGLQIQIWNAQQEAYLDLHEAVWHGRERGESEAYRGVTVKQVPNFAMCYAANSNLNHNSIISIIEAEVEHFSRLVGRVLREGKTQFCVKDEAHDAFNSREQQLLKDTAFSADCDSWYKHKETGKILTNWHGSLSSFWLSTAPVVWEHYNFE